jgi:hypothetical protein
LEEKEFVESFVEIEVGKVIYKIPKENMFI